MSWIISARCTGTLKTSRPKDEMLA
jgi:hypothetical protein